MLVTIPAPWSIWDLNDLCFYTTATNILQQEKPVHNGLVDESIKGVLVTLQTTPPDPIFRFMCTLPSGRLTV